jgi:hypothetical protein
MPQDVGQAISELLKLLQVCEMAAKPSISMGLSETLP